jgi:hypothetical protein
VVRRDRDGHGADQDPPGAACGGRAGCAAHLLICIVNGASGRRRARPGAGAGPVGGLSRGGWRQGQQAAAGHGVDQRPARHGDAEGVAGVSAPRPAVQGQAALPTACSTAVSVLSGRPDWYRGQQPVVSPTAVATRTAAACRGNHAAGRSTRAPPGPCSGGSRCRGVRSGFRDGPTVDRSRRAGRSRRSTRGREGRSQGKGDSGWGQMVIVVARRCGEPPSPPGQGRTSPAAAARGHSGACGRG